MRLQTVTLDSSTPGVRLAGTIGRPTGTARGLALLLSGSGPMDRDESLAGHRPFARLRRGLAERGYASVSWDDRGVGSSGGDYDRMCSSVLVQDVLAVTRQIVELDSPRLLVLVGHSQGAHVAALTAARRAFDGLVLLAGTCRPGRTVLLEQHDRICVSEGVDAESRVMTRRMKEDAFDVLARYSDDLSPRALDELGARLVDVVGAYQSGEELQDTVRVLLEWEWRFLLRHDAPHWIRKTGAPFYVAAGDRDVQVDAGVELECFRRVLKERGTIRLFRGLNHLFQDVGSGSSGGISRSGEAFAQPVLDGVSSWLDALTGDPPST